MKKFKVTKRSISDRSQLALFDKIEEAMDYAVSYSNENKIMTAIVNTRTDRVIMGTHRIGDNFQLFR